MMVSSVITNINVKIDCGVVITEVPPYTWPAHFTAVSTDLVLSGVLSTLPNPTIDLVIPVNNVPLPTKH
jgi:hypothetical protein